MATAAAILGGPALYLVGNALFKRLSASRLPLSHLVGLGLLAVLVPVAPFVSPLILASGATLVLIVVPVWEWRSLRHTADVAPPSDSLERDEATTSPTAVTGRWRCDTAPLGGISRFVGCCPRS